MPRDLLQTAQQVADTLRQVQRAMDILNRPMMAGAVKLAEEALREAIRGVEAGRLAHAGARPGEGPVVRVELRGDEPPTVEIPAGLDLAVEVKDEARGYCDIFRRVDDDPRHGTGPTAEDGCAHA